MKRLLQIIGIGIGSFVCLAGASDIENDQQAYEYCCENKNAFIAIVWPIAEGKDQDIERALSTYGEIKYKKSVYLTRGQAYRLLRMAHRDIISTKEMPEHVRWYFPSGTYEKPARIYVWKCVEGKPYAVTCKHAIRRMFNLQYRAIHINDTHKETVELAKFLFY